jgi:hypothetical protein
MELDILPSGDVKDPGGVGIGEIRNASELGGVEPSLRDLDPEHLDTGLPLAVYSMLETERFKLLRLNPALLEAVHFVLIDLDLL